MNGPCQGRVALFTLAALIAGSLIVGSLFVGCANPNSLVGTWKSRAGVTITLGEQGEVYLQEGDSPAFLAGFEQECSWHVENEEIKFVGTDPDGEELTHVYQYSLMEGGRVLHIMTPRAETGNKGRVIPVSWSFFRQ